ncbi:MAG: hypothetical protein ACRCUB_02465, partial [Plesiomonas shigelloides]
MKLPECDPHAVKQLAAIRARNRKRQKTEDRRQKTEDRRQKTEDRRVTPSSHRAQRKQLSLAQDKQNNASGANKSKKISPHRW